VDADQPLGCPAAHRVGDGSAYVAALGDVLLGLISIGIADHGGLAAAFLKRRPTGSEAAHAEETAPEEIQHVGPDRVHLWLFELWMVVAVVTAWTHEFKLAGRWLPSREY